jgi:hypothetical protein
VGEAQLSEALYRPLIALLGDHAPRSIAEIRQSPAGQAFEPGQLVQALTILVGKNMLTQVQAADTAAELRRQTDRLNRHLLDQARGHSAFGVLASPVTGGGVRLDRATQLFALAVAEGRGTAEALVQVLLAFGGGAADASDSYIAQAQRFLDLHLPVLKALGVVG